MANIAKKALIYIRVSHKNQVEHGHSLENQLDRLKKYVDYKGYELYSVIEDRGISGTSTQRDGFQEMMSLLDTVDVIVVYSLSRLSRSVIDTLQTIDKFTKHNVEFHSLNENIDTSNSRGKFFLTVMSALAEMESEQMSERIKSVMQFRKESGAVYCGNPPYGYAKKGDKLIPVPHEQENIETMKQLKAGGLSYGAIAARLNDDDIKTKKGKKFESMTVYKILKNEIHL